MNRSGGPALAANTTRTFPVTGVCGIPSAATAIAATVTVVGGTDVGGLRLLPAGTLAPDSSTINLARDRVRANNAIILLGVGAESASNGSMPPESLGHVHFLLDVTGYFQ